jgi:hypothetical protein
VRWFRASAACFTALRPEQTVHWLCSKNNSVGEAELIADLVGRLFSFQSEDFPDELNFSFRARVGGAGNRSKKPLSPSQLRPQPWLFI